MIASRRRKEAETEAPMMPPTREKLLNLVEMAEAVPATAMEIIITMLYFFGGEGAVSVSE